MGGINGYPALPVAGSPLKAYQRFLFWAAGAGRDFLQDCVEAEKFKYECIGALICLTATLASVSMFMAVWLTWAQDFRGPVLALPIALLWGILIFTIDRFMVSSLRADAAWSFRLWQALPRLVLAVIIGVIISRPIEIKIFETEIMKVIDSEIARNLDALGAQIEDVSASIREAAEREFQVQNGTLEDEVEGLRREQRTLTDDVAGLRAELTRWERAAEVEGDGTGGSGRRGEGDRYRQKRQLVAEYKERWQDARAELSDVEARLQDKLAERRQLVEAIEREKTLARENSPQLSKLREIQRSADDYGFLELNLALHRLARLPQFMPAAAAQGGGLPPADDQQEVDAIVSSTLWGITLLFITIEVLPILTKLMAPAGQYDEKMQSAPYTAQMLSMGEMAAVARARMAFLDQYEQASSALYARVFERVTGDHGRTDTVVGALWEHLRGGLDETLTRLRGHHSPFAAVAPELAESSGPAVVPAPQVGPPLQRASRLRGRVLVSVTTTALMFFVSFFYLLYQPGVEPQEAINTAATIAGLAFPVLTTILLRHSGPEK